MHSYDVEAHGLGELAEEDSSDEDSGSGLKRTSFEDSNGVRRTETQVVNGGEGSSYGGGGAPLIRAATVERERVSVGGSKGFDQLRR